ncbi:MAG: glyoxalase [Clostridiales bacterium]|nr:glyoxalase [Clostridiales bacterium]
MGEYDRTCIQVFLENQLQLFPEKVADTPEEAEEFLEMCMACVCKNLREVRDCFDEYGADISGMTKTDLEKADEVFPLPDGRYLVVLA